MTSSKSLKVRFASFRAVSTGFLSLQRCVYESSDQTIITANYSDMVKRITARYLSRRSEHSSSNLALVSVASMCFGPSAVAVIKGKLQEQFAQCQ